MKICQQRPDYTKLKSRIDKDVGLAGPGNDTAVVGRCYVFQRPDCGCAHGNNSATLLHCLVDLGSRLLGDVIAFAMHFVVFHAVGVNGLKRSQADVERNFGNVDSARADVTQDLGCEMQTGRWRGDTAAGFRPGVNGLVALPVLPAIFTRDVRRQGDMAESFQHCEEVRHRLKAESSLTKITAPDNFRSQFRVFRLNSSGAHLIRAKEKDPLADIDLSSRADQRLPLIGCDLSREQYLHLSA